MQFFVCLIFHIPERNLPVFTDRFVQQLYVIEKLAVIRPVLRQHGDIADPGSEINIRKIFQLFHKVLTLAVRNMSRKDQAVDQQTEFAVCKLSFQVKIRPGLAFFHHRFSGLLIPEDFTGLLVFYRNLPDGFAVFNLISAVHQIHQVAADCFPVRLHIIFIFQDISDLFLTQAVILIRIFPQDI